MYSSFSGAVLFAKTILLPEGCVICANALRVLVQAIELHQLLFYSGGPEAEECEIRIHGHLLSIKEWSVYSERLP